MSSVIYLYCFARAGTALPARGIGEGDELLAYRFEDLAAIYQWSESEQWSGPQAEARLRELQWLGPRAVRHQTVVAAVMRNSPVLPARLGTLFSSPQALQRLLATHRRTIARFLAQVAAREEWAVKALLDRTKATDWLSSCQAVEAGTQPQAPGIRYLRERRMRAGAARELNGWVAKTLEPIVEELRGHAAGLRRREASGPGPDGEAQAVLNLAFLVARDRMGDFRICVERANRAHAAHGLELALSGPWPPYSFCPALEMPP